MRLSLSPSTRVTLTVIAIFAVATFARIIRLDRPATLHADEASFLLNTIAIKETGRDEDGQRFPIWLNSYIDPKPALYSYLQLPFVAALGPTLVASRLLSVILGVLSIGVIGMLFRRWLTLNQVYITMLVLSLSPWHVMLSRASQEVMLSFFLSVCSLFCWQKLRDATLRKPWQESLWVTFFFITTLLAMYSYHSAKIFLPLCFAGWWIEEMLLHWHNGITKPVKSMLLFLTAVVIAFWLSFGLSTGQARMAAVSIFSDPTPSQVMTEQITRATGSSPYIVLRFFFNKVTVYGRYIFQRYGQHFTTNFLFLDTAQPLRYKLQLVGLLHLIEIIPLIVGTWALLVKAQYERLRWPLVIMLFTAPLAASLTYQEIPSMIRSFPMVIATSVVIAIGLSTIWSWKKWHIRWIFLTLILGGYIWGILFFYHQLFILQPIFKSWYRNEAEADVAAQLPKYMPNYSKVVVTQEVKNIYAYLVLAKLIPIETLQHSYPNRMNSSYTLGQFTFLKDVCLIDHPDAPVPDENTLYITKLECVLRPEYIELGKAHFGDGRPEYTFYRFDPDLHKLYQRM